ncbi:type II and III secretion system protein family protein [Paraburkholderia fungorum]|uniref:Type II and III secretion system protein family protein n=1 Tax=Paraburkholderia fungorum TaxID=134537 RepID=A0AAP5Q9K7_9BURK|nr:type II and III secretion system protein family protein [Paraburkholderia fungorum]MDT8839184.1 type II and III secretion system protein family protein [Paraburkholderia fungorum]PRZ54799.1 pilus assembly protein CpaC [Paraburkholderia fungorum]
MKTELGFSSGSHARRRSLSGTVLAAALCAGMAVAQSGAAQEIGGTSAPGKGGANAALPVGRGPVPMMISMSPMPSGPAASGKSVGAVPLSGPSCSGEIRDESSVAVAVGKSVLVPLAEPARNRTLGNPTVAQATLVSPRTLYLVGMTVGTTNMIVQGRSGQCQIIDVIVNIDSDGLQRTLQQLLPAERGIRVSTAAGNLVLAGRVSGAQAAQQAMEIANAYAGAQPTQQQQASTANFGAGGSSLTQQSTSVSKASEVINMMTVDSPQQVMLEVKVAEVSKTLLNQLGAAVNIQGGFGSWTGALVSSLLAGVGNGIAVSKANKLPFNVAVDAQKTDSLGKILAEPNLVTLSGQEASFLAGGRVFIPVPQSNGTGGSTITLQEEEFGVGLKFTPTVLAGSRINLKVAPEVSELSPTGVTVTATNVSGAAILPLITTRRASTTVQMNDGESFAIGGLIQNNITGSLKAIPGLGEVPVLGALFRSTSFQQDRTELVFIITVHLVKPLPSSTDYPLPTDSFRQTSDAGVYATGNMEGRQPQSAAPAPAPAAPGAPPTPAPVPAPAAGTSAAPAQLSRDTQTGQPAPVVTGPPDGSAAPAATPLPAAAPASVTSMGTGRQQMVAKAGETHPADEH